MAARKFLHSITILSTVPGGRVGAVYFDEMDPADIPDLSATYLPVSHEVENKDSGSLDAGTAVTVHSSGTGVRKADAATAGYECIGLVFASAAPTFAAEVWTTGRMTQADWSAATGGSTLTPNAPYYLSATPGLITTTPPTTTGHRVQQVGVAVSPDTLAIQILPPILL